MKNTNSFYALKTHLKPFVYLFFVLLTFACSKDDVDDKKTMTPPNNTTSEDKAPLFSLASLDNGTINLADYENKVVVLYFFGSNCPFCIAAGPDIEKKLKTPFAANDDYAIIGLDQWNGNNAAVNAFKSRTGITFPLLLNASSVATTYQTTYDRLIVLNKEREVVFKGTQLAGNDLAAAEAKVLELVTPKSDNNHGSSKYSFTLKSLDGNDVSLSDYDNKVVSLFFFGNGCPTCKSAASTIQRELVNSFSSNDDYVLLGLDVWNGNSASVQAFKTSTGVSYPLLLKASSVASDFETSYDRIVVLDKNKEIAFKGSRNANGDIATAKAKISTLLSN